MSTGDLVVTIQANKFEAWIEEGDLPGQIWSGNYSWFRLGKNRPVKSCPGDRVYVICRKKLIGYSPLYGIKNVDGVNYLVRRGEAIAVTIDQEIKGFQGFRYRWWNRNDEEPFPDWKEVMRKPIKPIGAESSKRKAEDEFEELQKLKDNRCLWVHQRTKKDYIIENILQREHNTMPGSMVSLVILREAGGSNSPFLEVDLKSFKKHFKKYSLSS